MVKHVFVHHFFQKRRVILHYFSRIRSDCSLFLGVAIVYLHSNFSEFQDWHRKARMRAEDVVNSWEMWPQQVLAMNNCLHNLWITCCLETVVILISLLCIPYTYIYICKYIISANKRAMGFLPWSIRSITLCSNQAAGGFL